MESLIGLLHHAAQVVRPGRSFVHQLIAHLKGRRRPWREHIRLNKNVRADIQWWQVFISVWNRVSLSPASRPVVTLWSDASGSWGCGAYSDSRWFQFQWTENCMARSIEFKELLPILLAVLAWGRWWQGSVVQCRCDNAAVVCVLASRYSKSDDIMHLLRCLFFLEACMLLHHMCQGWTIH